MRLHPNGLGDHIHDAAGFSGAALHVRHLVQNVCRREAGDVADSGWPIPFGKWQESHARTSPWPFATMDGMAGCSSGNQSGGFMRSSTCASV